MNLCSDGHEEVCYECRNCPVCDGLKEAEKESDRLQDIIDDLKFKLEEAS